VSHSPAKSPMTSVYMMDLWCQIPFYDAYLCNALEAEGIACVLGSTNFHLEPGYFQQRGVKNDPGFGSFASGLNISNPRVRRSLRFLEFVANISALTLRFRFARPDLIHVQWIPLVAEGVPFELWFLKLAQRRGVKIVYTVHNLLPHDSEPGVRETFARIYRMMDGLICHTRETKDRLIAEFGLDGSKIRIIPHGPLFYDYTPVGQPEAKRRIGLQPENCIVLYQGLVRPYKGIDFLLDAWKKVQAEQPDARLVIAGRGEDRHMEFVKARVATDGVQGSVQLDLRYITSQELPIYYQAADIAIYPHREITQSGALMTGIAFGKPIVATSLPGFREALEGYHGAVCVEYGDVEGLSQLLLTLISDPAKREALAQPSAGEDARLFWKDIARRTRECYDEVLRGPAPDHAPGEVQNAAAELEKAPETSSAYETALRE